MGEARTPTVQMLWETADPGAALEERFGFADATAAQCWVLTLLDAHWGLRTDFCERIVISDRNALAWVTTPSGRMLVKWSVAAERFPSLAALAELTVWLDDRGLPVAPPIPTVDGRLQVDVDGASLCLQPVIDGDLLDTTRADQVRAAGAVLARLHEALAVYPHSGAVLDLVAAPSRPLGAQVRGWLDSSGASLPEAARDALGRLLAAAPPDSLPTQLVHGDYRSANLLCVGGDVAAVIDFEEARADHRVVELARSAVMLGTRYRAWGPVSAEVRAGFLDGYQSQRRLTSAEAGWWDVLVLWYSLILTPSGDDPSGWGTEVVRLVAELETT